MAATRRWRSHASEDVWCTTLSGVRRISSAAPLDGFHGAMHVAGAGHVGPLGASGVAILLRQPALLPVPVISATSPVGASIKPGDGVEN